MHSNARRHVLLLDSEPMTEHLYSRALRLAGMDVTLAADVDEARAALSTDGIDAIALNTGDPPCADSSRVLRELAIGRDIPIVLIGSCVPAARLVHAGGVFIAQSAEPREVVALLREAMSPDVVAA